MKEKIFDFMRDVQGWHLDDNTNEDFDKVLRVDNSFLERQYMKFDELVDKRQELTLSVNELEDLRDAIGFIIDYVYASNSVNRDLKQEEMQKLDIKGELEFYLESELNDTEDEERQAELMKIANDEDKKREIVDSILDDNELNNELTICLEWYVNHRY